MRGARIAGALVAAGLGAMASYDLLQRRHALLRNFPLVGHLRYALEAIGPELRQYIVTDNDDERPFTRDQRRWIYASSKQEDNYFGFGTDNDIDRASSYVIVKPVVFPYVPAGPLDPKFVVPCVKVMGSRHGRTGAFRPQSIVNVSGMSFGSLSSTAIEALNRGVALAECYQGTGEGGLSEHHRHGGDLVWQIGTGYFGCRDSDGNFDLARLVDTAASAPVRAIEIKLSQGAKPGLGGMLPAAKISPEIAAIRGVPIGQDCVSPPHHTAFQGVDGLIEFAETIAAATGLPVGIKSAVGELGFWGDLADRMMASGGGIDFITIDGGEGGTGAAPLVFSDHVALPFRLAFSRVYKVFAERGLSDQVVWIGSGKLGLPESALFALALGCDTVSIAREAMLAIGCIQAQRCHTGHCPTGVATQNAWLAGGLDPTLKSVRLANYIVILRHELLRLAHACGVAHPALVPLDQIELIDGSLDGRSAAAVFGYQPGWGMPSPTDVELIHSLVSGSALASDPPPDL